MASCEKRVGVTLGNSAEKRIFSKCNSQSTTQRDRKTSGIRGSRDQCIYSLRVGSLGVLFARVPWRRSHDLRAGEKNGARILLAEAARKSRLRSQDTRANNTQSEPARRLMTNVYTKNTHAVPSHAVFELEVFRTSLASGRILPCLFRNLCRLSIKPARKKMTVNIHQYIISIKLT